MNTRFAALLPIALLGVLCSCRVESAARRDTPALLVKPDAAVIAELSRTVSTALGGRRVTLSPDALTKSNLLIVEPSIHRNLQGRMDSGRLTGRPEKFRLFLRGSRCVIVQDAGNFSAVLEKAHCKPLPH